MPLILFPLLYVGKKLFNGYLIGNLMECECSTSQKLLILYTSGRQAIFLCPVFHVDVPTRAIFLMRYDWLPDKYKLTKTTTNECECSSLRIFYIQYYTDNQTRMPSDGSYVYMNPTGMYGVTL
jgi:hypothetical protein